VQRGITILSAGAFNTDQIEAQEPDETHVVMRCAIRTSCPMLNQKGGTVGNKVGDKAQISLDSAMGGIFLAPGQQHLRSRRTCTPACARSWLSSPRGT